MDIAPSIYLEELRIIDMSDFDERRGNEKEVWRMKGDAVRPTFPFDRLTIAIRLAMFGDGQLAAVQDI